MSTASAAAKRRPTSSRARARTRAEPLAHLTCVTIDAHEPVRLAAFWAEALGWSLEANSWDRTKNLVRRPDDAFYLEFVPTHDAKVEKIRMHFGLSCDDIEAEMDRLEALGATHAWEEIFWGRTNDYRNVVMRDPEGNEFCLGEGPEL